MIAVLLSLTAGAGAYLVVSSGTKRQPRRTRQRRSFDAWLNEAGLGEVKAAEFFGVLIGLAAIATLLGYAVFGGLVPALAIGAFAASWPLAGFRQRREVRRAKSLDAWPRMIEEMRILTATVGRSIPQALFEVGLRGPEELRPAFAAAQREWLMSADFTATLGVLKAQLADATADAVCETLLVAHEVGGSEIERRLEALAEDRSMDLQGRKDARSRQAGARFARRFVLIVPAGMALVGLSVGNGREAYQKPFGQAAVCVGILLVIFCWAWAGRVMRLPVPRRVFGD